MSEYGWSGEYIDNMIPFEKILLNGLLINRRREAQIMAEQAASGLTPAY